MYRIISILLLLPLLAWTYNIGDQVTVQYNGSPSKYNFTLDASTQARFQFSNIQGTQFFISFSTGSTKNTAGLYIPMDATSFTLDTRAVGCPLQQRNIQLYIEGQAGNAGSLSFTSSLVPSTLVDGVNSLTVPSGDSLASPAKYIIPAQSCQNVYVTVEGAIPSLTLDCGQDLSVYAANSACSGSSTTFSSNFIATTDGTGLTEMILGCGPSGNYVLNLLTTGAESTVDYSTTYKCTQACANNGGICYKSQCVCPASFQSGSGCDVIAYKTETLNTAFYYQDNDYVRIDIPSSVSAQSVLTITYTSGNQDGFVYFKNNAPATKGNQPASDAVAVALRGGQSSTVTSVCFPAGLSGYVSAYFQVESQGTISFSTSPAIPQIQQGDSVFTSTGSDFYFRYTVQSLSANVVVTVTNNSAVSLIKQDAYTSPSVFSLSSFATENACAPASATTTANLAYVKGNVVYQSIDYDSSYVYILVEAASGTRFTINIAENPAYCPDECNSNGVCISGGCVCSEYYSGSNCATSEPVFDPQEFPLATTGNTFTGTGTASFRTRVPAGSLPVLDISTNTPVELLFSDDASDLDLNVVLSAPFNGFVYSNECPTSRGDSFFNIGFVPPEQVSNPSYSVTPSSVNVTLVEGNNAYTWKTSKEVLDYSFSHAFFQSAHCDTGKSFTVQVSGGSYLNEDSTDVRVLYNVDDGCNSYTAVIASYNSNSRMFSANIPSTLECMPFIVIVDISPDTIPSSIQYSVSVSSQNACGQCYNGNCVDNKCVCNEGFFGTDCASSNSNCLAPTTLNKCKSYVNYPFSFAGSLTPSCSSESILIPVYSTLNNISTQCQAAATQVSCQSALYPCTSSNGISNTKFTGPSTASCNSLVAQCGALYSSQLSRVAALGEVYSYCGIQPITSDVVVVTPTTAPVTISPTVKPPTSQPKPTTRPPTSSPTTPAANTGSSTVSAGSVVSPSAMIVVALVSVLFYMM